MNSRTSILIACAACASLSSACHAESFESFYKHYLKQVSRAYETGNEKFFDAIATPDFTETQAGHTVKRQAAFDEMDQQFKLMKHMTCKYVLVSSKVSGNSATTVSRMRAEIVMKPDNSGKSHVLSLEESDTETWVTAGSTWKLKHVDAAKPTKIVIDGKPFDPADVGG
jgi:hypothetical protein